MGATLFAYNYGTTHRGLFELMNHNAPIVKTLTGMAHRRTGDKPYVYNKRAWIHPRRPKQFKNEADKLAGIQNPNYNRILDISPGSIDARKEAVIVALKRKQNKDLREYYNQRRATSFPEDGGDIVVQTRKLNKAGYEGHLDDLFGKRRNEKSQTVLVKQRRETRGEPANTFDVQEYSVQDTRTGKKLKRHYLPWELEKVGKIMRLEV